jgi:hypothetical protein
VDLNRSATSEPHDDEDDDIVGALVLLDFLMGDSLAGVAARHRLRSVTEAEALLRAVLLRHGYAARGPRDEPRAVLRRRR